jgi:hypothetical protein
MNQVQAAAAADEALKEASIRTLRSTPTTRPRWTITAWPYLKAIKNNDYGHEDPVMCVLYALSNMTGWKGETARRIKAELNASIKEN